MHSAPATRARIQTTPGTLRIPHLLQGSAPPPLLEGGPMGCPARLLQQLNDRLALHRIPESIARSELCGVPHVAGSGRIAARMEPDWLGGPVRCKPQHAPGLLPIFNWCMLSRSSKSRAGSGALSCPRLAGIDCLRLGKRLKHGRPLIHLTGALIKSS